MSDRNNTDNQNTDTIYIPPEVRNVNPPPQRPLRRVEQNENNPQYYNQGQYSGQQQYNPQYDMRQPIQNPQYYNQGQYSGQQQYNPQYDMRQPMQNPQYYNQGQYGGQPYYGQPYNPPPPRKSNGKKKKKRRKRSFFGRFISRFIKTLIMILVLIFGMYSCTSLCLINKMDYAETGDRNRRSDALARSYVKNVLLIGTDGRSENETARSDTMLLASVNRKTNEVSLISLMRDCYVEIPGYGEDKLNAAYAYGGAELLMDTIEHNFGIAVEDYVAVNFVSFASVVDSVGGIDIEISDAEAKEINTILQAEVNEIMGDDVLDDLLDGGGKLHLNGKQALSYARIRYIGNADFERTERQREVIELVMNKVKSFNPTILPRLSFSVLPGVETNMTTAELYGLSLELPFIAGYERQQLQIPAEGTYYSADMDCGNSLIVDFVENYNIIYETVYEE
ncbi:MAG: LCP family protein [Ruminococcus sp.]|nr:LCP family protein [Ruminococcus sp.]